MLTLLLALLSSACPSTASDFGAKVSISWPLPGAEFEVGADVASVLCYEAHYTNDLLAAMANGSLALSQRLCHAAADRRAVSVSRPPSPACSDWFNGSTGISLSRPAMPVRMPIELTGVVLLTLHLRFCYTSSSSGGCATRVSPSVAVKVINSNMPNPVLATTDLVSRSLADPRFQRFRLIPNKTTSARNHTGLALELTRPNRTGLVLHQVEFHFYLRNGSQRIALPPSAHRSVICFQVKFNVYSTSYGRSCVRTRPRYVPRRTDTMMTNSTTDTTTTLPSGDTGHALMSFQGLNASIGLGYLTASLWLHVDPDAGGPIPCAEDPDCDENDPQQFYKSLLTSVKRPTTAPDLRSKVQTVIFANSNAYNPTFYPNVLTWSELRQRRRVAALPRILIDEPSSDEKTRASVYMAFAWTDDYVHSAAVLGLSLWKAESKFGLVIVVPSASVDSGDVSLQSLAALHGKPFVKRVVVLNNDGSDAGAEGPTRKLTLRRAFLERFGQEKAKRMYLKLLAFSFTEYAVVAVIDADSIALESAARDGTDGGPLLDLVMAGLDGYSSSFFRGVGQGIMPGSLFVARPSLPVLSRMLMWLKTFASWRFNEMGFLNAMFGSGSCSSANCKTAPRLPESASCTPVTSPAIIRDGCASFDFSFCGRKPWSRDALQAGCAFALMSPNLNEKFDLAHVWSSMVRQWQSLSAQVRGWWTQQQRKHTQQEGEGQGALMREIGIAIMDVTVQETLGKVDVVVNVRFDAINSTRIVCARNRKIMACETIDGDFPWNTNISLRVDAHRNRVGDAVQQRVVVYCMRKADFDTHTVHDHALLLRLSAAACGKAEAPFGSLAAYKGETVDFLDAQVYVSGGIGVAKRKWETSGRAQFEMLYRNIGLRPHHRVLEFGCGTLNLARFLLEFLLPGNFVCVEPNEWLVESTLSTGNHSAELLMLLLKQRGSIHFRDDFRLDDGQGGEPFSSRGFDVIFGHSVLSHAGERQMKQYFGSVSELLAEGGVAVASMCLCSPCNEVPRVFEEGGGVGGTAATAAACRYSEDKEWIYPYVSWWRPSRVNSLAEVHGLEVQRRGDLREAVVGKSPADGHDWVTVVRSGLREPR
jgi:SAM-dependent methyltransferase